MSVKNILDKSWKALCGFIIFTFVISCGDKAALSESTAINSVEAFLKANPIYETVSMEIGEVKFRLKKDEKKLKIYKDLADKGYIDFELAKQKKKFLSKDSIFVYDVKLTDKARPFIFKQKKDLVEVKSFEYFLDEKEQAKIELSGKKSGKVVITLKKVNTDFSELAVDQNPHTNFITRTFTLNYKKDNGWVATKSK